MLKAAPTAPRVWLAYKHKGEHVPRLDEKIPSVFSRRAPRRTSALATCSPVGADVVRRAGAGQDAAVELEDAEATRAPASELAAMRRGVHLLAGVKYAPMRVLVSDARDNRDSGTPVPRGQEPHDRRIWWCWAVPRLRRVAFCC